MSVYTGSAAALLLAGCLASVRLASVHAPYGRHNCEACHDVGGTLARGVSASSYSDRVKEEAAGGDYSLSPGEEVPSLLRYRVDRLCFQCHRELDPASPGYEGKWLHGPFQAGVCLACHQPHESANPRLLVAYPVEKLCSMCHSGFHGKEGASRYPGKPCLACHSPHSQEKAARTPD
ncbi:MAG: cytochrome c3 family protein [Elusimicrobia bacterium]|nr:cytochrome c3 family protein [Elusimicrobiota bacterium]